MLGPGPGRGPVTSWGGRLPHCGGRACPTGAPDLRAGAQGLRRAQAWAWGVGKPGRVSARVRTTCSAR